MKKILRTVDEKLAKIESGFISFFLIGLVFAGVIQILLRRLTNYAIPDLEVTMRWTVVWLTFFGASLATREKKHISVDVIGRLFTGGKKRFLNILIDVFSLFIVILLFNTSREFINEEIIYGGNLMNDIPAWIIELIIPLGFLLISVRLLIHIINNLFAPRTNEDAS